MAPKTGEFAEEIHWEAALGTSVTYHFHFGYSNSVNHFFTFWRTYSSCFLDIPILTIESFLRWYVTNRSVVECSEMTRMCRYCTHWPTLTTVANWIFDFGHEQTANGPHYKYDSMSHGSRPAYSWVR